MEKIKGNKIITKRANGTTRVVTMPEGKSRTQKQFKDDCNVNLIIAKFKKTGSVAHVRNNLNGVYADLTNLPDLHEAQMVVSQAEQAFAEVPSAIRARFGHDPNAFIEFLKDPKNDEEAIKLGLKIKKPIKNDPILDELKTLNKNLSTKPKTKPKIDTET